MNKLYAFFCACILSIPSPAYSQKMKTDANIVGHVVCCDRHIPYANVAIKGTTMGTVTDETGHYQLINVPVGTLTVAVSCLGYKTKEETLTIENNQTKEIKFELEEEVMSLTEVVVSADRSQQKRHDAPVMVNTISPKLFAVTHSTTLGEGLNFCPGLRVENNCQNCGFTQVRMNGMEGPYSQILVNSRPIFSGLAGVYGLELIPSNMIERIEVVRGGGSSLFGSNAIAGTINLILKEPASNMYEVVLNTGLIGMGLDGLGKPAPDYSANFNTALVSDDRKTGAALYGFTRKRQMFDANGDDFSEIAPLSNLTLGMRVIHRFGYRSKMAVDFFTIKEERDGGNRQDYPLHERDLAEAVRHDIKTGALTYERFFRETDLLSVFFSGQHLDRNSYYGANRSLGSYGHSKDFTGNYGIQYKAVFSKSSLVTGIEKTTGHLRDEKLGYPDYDNAIIVNDSLLSVPHTDNTLIADQTLATTGAFLQYELTWKRLKMAAGGRYDFYRIFDNAGDGEGKTGNVFSPRVSLMFKMLEYLQLRGSYSQGYRAPQIFDEDLHIETSGSRQVINKNDPNLKQETSHSLMASIDFNKRMGDFNTGILLEGFYTRLDNPFVNDMGTPDESGTVIYTRRNAEDGATVMGVNAEAKFKPGESFEFSAGFTFQESKYDAVQEFDEKRFFRTPDNYGFFTIDWDLIRDFCFSATGNYTGEMLLPYFGPDTETDAGELRQSDPFFDLGIKLRHNIRLNGTAFQWFFGVRNIFNSYQSDFDEGIDRDPAYIYGPGLPRMVYIGIKVGNNITRPSTGKQRMEKSDPSGHHHHKHRRNKHNP